MYQVCRPLNFSLLCRLERSELMGLLPFLNLLSQLCQGLELGIPRLTLTDLKPSSSQTY